MYGFVLDTRADVMLCFDYHRLIKQNSQPLNIKIKRYCKQTNVILTIFVLLYRMKPVFGSREMKTAKRQDNFHSSYLFQPTLPKRLAQ